MSWLSLHIVFGLGGGLGAVLRHFLTKLVTHRFPLSTLLVNIIGSFVLGVGTGFFLDASGQIAAEQQRLIFGFCGGFTTFSSFAYQSLDLHREETLLHAAANIITSLLLCLIFYGMGLYIT